MNKLTTIILAAVALTSPQAWADGRLEELASLMEGRFDSQAGIAEAAPDTRLIDMRMRVDAPNLGDVVFYQQINQKENLEVYRQRILVLSVADGSIEQSAYALNQPEWYVDADANVFASLSMDELDAFMPDGCEMTWKPVADGFKGHVNPKTCEITSSRTGKPRQIEAEALLTATTLSLAERGFDPDSGDQLFGTKAGEYLLLGRVSD